MKTMKQILKYTAKGIVFMSLGLLLLMFLLWAAGFYVNTTKSIPLGLYQATSKPPTKGDYVLVCPPQKPTFETAKERGYIGAGFCPGGYGYLMKRISGVGGDQVNITESGLMVNGELLPHSKLHHTDKAGQPLPNSAQSYVLKQFEILLMSDVSSTSFDGRYFGPINRNQIKTGLRPVITW